MKISHLAYFIEVANCGSINKAAANLYLKHGNLSKIIQSLESQLDTQLFYRTNSGVTLTENGRLVLEWAQEVLSSQKNLIKKLKDKPCVNKINYYSSPSTNAFMFANFYKKCLEMFPNITFSFVETDVDTVICNVETVPLSIGQIYLSEKQLEYVKTKENLIFYPSFDPQLCACAHYNNPYFKRRKKISIKNLLDMPILLHEKSYSFYADIFRKHGNPSQLITADNIVKFNSIFETEKYITFSITPRVNHIGNSECITVPIKENIKTYVGFLMRAEEKENQDLLSIRDLLLQFLVQYIV